MRPRLRKVHGVTDANPLRSDKGWVWDLTNNVTFPCWPGANGGVCQTNTALQRQGQLHSSSDNSSGSDANAGSSRDSNSSSGSASDKSSVSESSRDRDSGSDGSNLELLRKGDSHLSFIPCLLKTHNYWVTHRQRLLIGVEKLAAQGFPAYIKTSYYDEDDSERQITDAELSSIAGNTISIPVIGSMMFLALGCTRLRLKDERAIEA